MRLKSNYEAQLIEHFQDIATYGVTHISTVNLKIWHDQERLTVTVWRTIADHWEEFLQNTKFIANKKIPLFVGDFSKESQHFAFVWGEGLTETPKGWLKNIESWT